MSTQAKGRHNETEWVSSITSLLDNSKEAHEAEELVIPAWALWPLLGLVILVLLALVGTAWGYLLKFYPSTACMVQMLFSTTCQ